MSTGRVVVGLGFLFAALAAGCAGPTYVTSHGLRVFDNTGLRIPRMGVEAVTESGERVILAYRFQGLSAARTLEAMRRIADAAAGAETQVLFDGGQP